MQTGHEGWNSCYTDVRTSVGLARLVEGGVASIDDIEAAENALQALMWHDRIDVIVPGFKYDQGNLVSYARCEERRSQVAFELLQPCVPYDQIYAVEEVVLENGLVTKSSLQESRIVGLGLKDAMPNYLKLTPLQAAAISSIPIDMGVPAYFTDPQLKPFFDKRGFSGDFYKAIRQGWEEATSVVPDIDFSIRLPPLVSIVLDRSSSRDSIPQTIRDLREELAPVRTEMLGLAESLRGPYNQRQVESRCRDVKASFEAVMPASRKPQTPFLLTLLQLYSAVKSPLDLVIKHLNPDYKPHDPRVLANRTVTGQKFTPLLAKTDSMYALLTHFFTEAEIRAMEASMRSQGTKEDE
jgi:hypothetical protein